MGKKMTIAVLSLSLIFTGLSYADTVKMTMYKYDKGVVILKDQKGNLNKFNFYIEDGECKAFANGVWYWDNVDDTIIIKDKKGNVIFEEER